MNGSVSDELEAIVTVRIGTQAGLTEFAAVIDTGFNGYLTAPPQIIAALGLAVCGDTEAALGDGREVRLPTYEAVAEWFDRRLAVPVLESQGGILLGMSLMRGCTLNMDVSPGGQVQITRV